MTDSDSSREGDWITTYTGIPFYPLDSRPEEIVIADIAHGLSNQCRYNGQCPSFYCVAQHSVLGSKLLYDAKKFHEPGYMPEDAAKALWAARQFLLHDGVEAYLPDVPRPLKNHPKFGWFLHAEHQLGDAIFSRFGLPKTWLPGVKATDNLMLAWEARDMGSGSTTTRTAFLAASRCGRSGRGHRWRQRTAS